MGGVELTYQDVAEHNTKKDIYIVVHDKIYDCTKFVDEHPGGEEVLLDVGGQDASEAFEDVGHSDEARETLDQLYIGDLKRQPGDPSPKKQTAPATSAGHTESPGFGIGLPPPSSSAVSSPTSPTTTSSSNSSSPHKFLSGLLLCFLTVKRVL
uniref:Cytochrome b5 n=1 Tax=Colletotrichum fructicola (strain Nara gc5) TaxID=1213859 RepID=L2G9E8_COLFN